MGFILTLVLIVYFAVCIFLIMVVLFQSGKGGGISGMFGGGGGGAFTDTFGASGAEKTLSRWTTYCAIAFLVLTLAITWIGAKQSGKSLIDEMEMSETAGLGGAPIEPSSTPIPLSERPPESPTGAPLSESE